MKLGCSLESHHPTSHAIVILPTKHFSMNRIPEFFLSKLASLLFASGLLMVFFAVSDARAQTTENSHWHSKMQERLKAIYERGEFRAKDFRPKWLRDSSGFVVQKQNTETKETTSLFHDVKSSEERSWEADDRLLESDDRQVSPQGKQRLVIRDAKLIAINLVDQKETLLANGESGRDVEYRTPHWSPDGTRVVFVEADMTDVRQRNVLVPSDPSYPDVQQNRFARVGEKIEKLRVGMVNSDGQQLTWLPIQFPEEGGYFGQVEWAGSSEEVLVEVFSRFRDRREFFLVNLRGEVQTILTETNEAWVESSQGKNSGLVWLDGGKGFVVISEKDGWRHAFRYERNGREVACLTVGDFDIIDRAVIDEAHGWYYFYASPDDATQKYLYRAALDGSGKSQRLTPPDQVGTHHYHFSPDAKWAIHTYSTLDTPPVHELIEVETHRSVRTLEDNSALRERMKSIPLLPTEFLKLSIDNGIELDAWILKPQGFDPERKYPVFVYVYGEPHSQTVLNEWGAAQIDFHRLIAEQGYVVVSIDNRGTPAPKGAAWRRSVFGSLGPLSTEEQEAGLKALAKQWPFIDTSRVGIWGWSGGGSNTLNAMFRKPEIYHVGIAVVPKPQPHLYNAWFQEIYMRTREVNAEGYEKAAAINYADGLQGKLLIMTGSGETNTHIQIIEGLVDKLIALGKPFDYMVYPNRDHGLREGDGTLVHVRMHILRYLVANLPAGPR